MSRLPIQAAPLSIRKDFYLSPAFLKGWIFLRSLPISATLKSPLQKKLFKPIDKLVRTG